jgi:hypothetical protein
MIRIDSLYILLLIEATAVIAAVAIYLYIRNRRYRRLVIEADKSKNNFRIFLQRHVEEKLKDMKESLSEDDEGNIELQIVRKMKSLTLQFLKISLDGVRKGDSDIKACWENIFKSFENSESRVK